MERIAKTFMGLAVMFIAASEALAEPWSLPRLLEYAREKSPDAEIAARRIAAARAKLEQAQAAFHPQLSVESGYMRTDNAMLAFGAILNQRRFSPTLDFNDVPAVDNFVVRGVVRVPLYTGGANVAGRQAAEKNERAARYMAEATRESLALEAARIYFAVQKARAFVKAAAAAVSAFDHNLEIARRRAAQGTILENEILDVEVQRAQAQEGLIRARNAEAAAQSALGALLGLDAAVEVGSEIPRLSVPDLAEARRRAELLSLESARAAAEAQMRQAQSGWYPQLNLVGGGEYNRGWRMDGEGGAYQAGVIAEWRLWDGHLTRARMREACAAVDEVREQLRKAEAGVRLEVEQAALNLKDADERLTVSRKAVVQAAASAALTRKRFEQGLTLATQVIDSQTALTAAQMRQAEAEADRNVAVAALRRAMGLPILSEGGEP